MALYKLPLVTLVETINAQNGLNLNLSEYKFSDPKVIPSAGLSDNTELTISSKDRQSTYSGQTTVTYRRLPLTEVVHQGNITIPSKGLSTTRDVYQAINRYYGTVFNDEDIEVRDLTGDELNPSTTIAIRALPNSYGWIGTATVSVREGGYELKDHLIYTEMDGFDYPNNRVNKPFGHIYSYWRDFSGHYESLIDIPMGRNPANVSILKTALEAVTGDAWATAGQSRYSLQGCDVLELVHPMADQLENYNRRYDNAVRVRLNDTYNTGIGGELILHFNTPIDLL